MPIIGQRLFDELDTERVLCVTGVLSGGKTRLGFELALYYWRMGFRVLSNVPHNFVGGALQHNLYKSFVVVDEGGEYVRKEKIASLVTRSAGKANYYVVFTGKRLPHKTLQGMVARPRFDFWTNYGIPVILWKVVVNADIPYKFTFWQIYPQRLHGTYSTRSSSGDPEQIFQLAQVTVDMLAEGEGQSAGVVREAGQDGFFDDFAGGSSQVS